MALQDLVDDDESNDDKTSVVNNDNNKETNDTEDKERDAFLGQYNVFGEYTGPKPESTVARDIYDPYDEPEMYEGRYYLCGANIVGEMASAKGCECPACGNQWGCLVRHRSWRCGECESIIIDKNWWRYGEELEVKPGHHTDTDDIEVKYGRG